MKGNKVVKITTIYNETFLAELLYLGINYIDTDKGRIPKNEIKEFTEVGECL